MLSKGFCGLGIFFFFYSINISSRQVTAEAVLWQSLTCESQESREWWRRGFNKRVQNALRGAIDVSWHQAHHVVCLSLGLISAVAGNGNMRQRGGVAKRQWGSWDMQTSRRLKLKFLWPPPTPFYETELGHSRYAQKLHALDESLSWHLGIYCDIFIASTHTHTYTLFVKHTHTHTVPPPVARIERTSMSGTKFRAAFGDFLSRSLVWHFHVLLFEFRLCISFFSTLFPSASTVEIFEY